MNEEDELRKLRRTLGAFTPIQNRSVGGLSSAGAAGSDLSHKAAVAKRWTTAFAGTLSQDLKLFLDSETACAYAVTKLNDVLSPNLGKYHSSDNVWSPQAVLAEVAKIQLITEVAALQHLGDVAGFGSDDSLGKDKAETQKALFACRRQFLRRLATLRDRCTGERVLCDALDEVVRCQPVNHFELSHTSGIETSMACRMVEERALTLLKPTEDRALRQSLKAMKEREEEMKKQLEVLRQRNVNAVAEGERSRSQSEKSALDAANAELLKVRKALEAARSNQEELQHQYDAREKEIQSQTEKIQGNAGDSAGLRAENVALKAEIENLQATLREAKAVKAETVTLKAEIENLQAALREAKAETTKAKAETTEAQAKLTKAKVEPETTTPKDPRTGLACPTCKELRARIEALEASPANVNRVPTEFSTLEAVSPGDSKRPQRFLVENCSLDEENARLHGQLADPEMKVTKFRDRLGEGGDKQVHKELVADIEEALAGKAAWGNVFEKLYHDATDRLARLQERIADLRLSDMSEWEYRRKVHEAFVESLCLFKSPNSFYSMPQKPVFSPNSHHYPRTERALKLIDSPASTPTSPPSRRRRQSVTEAEIKKKTTETTSERHVRLRSGSAPHLLYRHLLT